MTSNSLSPLSAYLAKLERRFPLPEEQRTTLLGLPAKTLRFGDRDAIVRAGDDAEQCIFLIEGLVTRQRPANGASQIISISLPGDAVDLQTLFFKRTDHSLVAHRSAVVALVPQGALIALIEADPLLAKLLWHDTLVDSAIFREWALNVGHRQAPRRIGFLFMELEARMAANGHSLDGTFQLPLSQQDIAGALGLSLVHMNKSLRRLREDGFVVVQGRSVHIVDRAALGAYVGFDPTYLQITATPALNKAIGLHRFASATR